MKLGVFSVSLPEYDLAESVALLKELGYKGIEWRVEPVGRPAWFTDDEVPFSYRYWVENKSTLDINNIMESALKAKTLCDEAGIEILGMSTSLPLANIEQLEKVLAAAKAVNCPMVRAGLVTYDAKTSEKNYPALRDEQRACLKALEPKLKEYGIKLVLETHHGTMIASPSAGYRMLEGLDPEYFGLIFDPGNMVYEGYEDYRMAFQILGPYLAHVHVKNSVLEYDGEDEFGAAKWNQNWATLRKGMANLKDLFEALVWIGYNGTMCVEDFSNENSTHDKLADNITYLQKLAEATGVIFE